MEKFFPPQPPQSARQPPLGDSAFRENVHFRFQSSYLQSHFTVRDGSAGSA
jgi:hypothetical protein